MKSVLENIFNLYGSTAIVNNINSDSELFMVNSSDYGMITICAKGITFGGRENLDYEQRVQIKASSNNYAFNRISQNEKAILLGVISNNNGDTIICAWKLKYSNGNSTISKQIKNGTIQSALSVGFAQQDKGHGEFACAFRKEFLYFYLKNLEWIHDGTVNDLNNHLDNAPYEEFIQEHSTQEYSTQIDEAHRLRDGTNVLLYGVPGSGKSYTVKSEYCNDPSKMERVVFHPDYTYSDFIGQILPCAKDDRISYEFTPGPFTKLLSKAQHDPANAYFLIIEEINRGNAPAIFGEVFQLLDRTSNEETKGTSEYGISNSDIAKIVYNGDENQLVMLPSNLNIIATMNTSDQNVFTLDTAFQRRWNMRMIENDVASAEHASVKILDTDVTWKVFNETINGKVLENNMGLSSSEDKRLGAYFVGISDLSFNATEEDVNASPAEKARARAENSRFPEKILKYLWDDAFKFSRESIFESQYRSLEELVKAFKEKRGQARFSVFKQGLFENSEQEQ